MTPEELDKAEKLAFEPIPFTPEAIWERGSEMQVAFRNMAQALREAWSVIGLQEQEILSRCAEAQAALAARDKAKAERDEVLHENIRLRTTMHFLREKAGYYRSDLEAEGKLSPSADKFRQLVRDKEWVTDGRESVTYCLWCQRTWQQGHAKDCEMFGPAGFVDPEVLDKE